MYESYFGFKKKPFNITPDPRFLYLSKKHREALAQLIYGLREKKGFVVLSGEVGTGKTTILRALLDRVDENCQAAYIFNTMISVVDFLKFVCHDLGLQVSDNSKIGYLIKLHDFLIESHNNGKTTALIVDEAQNLDASLFEEIRMLTNLETSSQKLLQIFLAGQPELVNLLDQSELWQLKQRISTRYHLLPLDRKETKEYIQTRMRLAGGKSLNCFTEGSIQEIYEYSGGIPRLINNICDNSLMIGYATDIRIIDEKIVRECASDLRLEKDHKARRKTKGDGKAENLGIRVAIAKDGDSVSMIIVREFGRLDVHLLEAVQKLNPETEDINRIVVGQEIRLPSDPREAYKNSGAPSYFSIHMGSFKRFDEANRLFNKLIEIGKKPTIIPANINGSAWYRVTIGEYEDFSEASVNAKRLVQSGQFGYTEPLKIPDL